MKNVLRLVLVCTSLLQSRTVGRAQGWFLTTAPTNLNWDSVAVSVDGQRMIASAGGEPGWVYISTNAGLTWGTNNLPDLGWTGVASSADGSTMVAAAVFGGIYLSTNFGVSWAPTQAPITNWWAVSTSADGSKLAAVVGGQSGFFEGSILVSTNSGGNWIASDAPTTNWSAIVASADGTKLAAAVGFPQTGPIFNSRDYGMTWTTNNNAPISSWVAIASSLDGGKLVAASTTAIYTSTNSGIAWATNRLPAMNWSGVASAADGQKLVAVANGASGIFTSTNGGTTWISNSVPQNVWWSVASSADGNRLVAVVLPDQGTNGGIYTAYVASSPRLTIARQPPASVEVSWMVPSTNFTLQQSQNLSAWVNVTNSPGLNLTNLQDQIALPLTMSNVFYRLKTP
jgi:hypothetical protein